MKDEAEITGFIGHDYIDQIKSSVFCDSVLARKLIQQAYRKTHELFV